MADLNIETRTVAHPGRNAWTQGNSTIIQHMSVTYTLRFLLFSDILFSAKFQGKKKFFSNLNFFFRKWYHWSVWYALRNCT